MADRMNRDGATVDDIQLMPEVDAYLVAPSDGGRGPAVVFLHWFDTEATDGNRTQFLDEAVALARDRGVVSVLPQGRFPWSSDPTDSVTDVERIRAEVSAHRAAVDLLAAREDVDRERIGLVGHDFGGMHGVLLAADDARIACAVLVAITPRWGDWFLPFWSLTEDRHDYLRALAPLDPITRIGDIAPRPVCLQFARSDFFIAAMTGIELHRAAGDTAEMHAYDADHAVRDDGARTDRRAFLDRALAMGDSAPG